MSIKEEIHMILALLPVGLGFRPTDEQLVDHYLKLKILGMASHEDIIPEVDVCKWEPWDVPVLCLLLSEIQTDDPEWFFFSPLHNKYSNGSQLRRTTNAGYWKPTGPDRKIKREATEEVIGTKKTLVFHMGSGRAGVNTGWVIHEYRACTPSLPANNSYALCRLKSPPKPKLNGMDMEVDNPSTSAEIHQNGAAHIRTSSAEGSHHDSNIVSDIRNYLPPI